MYTLKGRIRYSEVNHRRALTAEGLANYFQDTASFHGEERDNGLDAMKARGLAWLISGWYVRVYTAPLFCRDIISATGLCGVRLLSPVRFHRLTAADGTLLAEGYSEWLVLDTNTGHPIRPPQDIIRCYGIESGLSFANRSRHIRLPESMAAKAAFSVLPHEIDTNEHVNNSRYIGMAQSLLPAGFAVGAFQAEYRVAAKLGDVIVPVCGEEKDTFYVSLRNQEGRVFANVAFERRKAC